MYVVAVLSYSTISKCGTRTPTVNAPKTYTGNDTAGQPVPVFGLITRDVN